MARVHATRAIDQSRRHPVRGVGPDAPLRWLAAGWRDFMRCPGAGLAHGAAIAVFGLVLVAFGHRHFWGLSGAVSGFLLVAPILATGLYAISAALERGERPTLRTALAAWRPNDGRLMLFGVLLAAAGTGWVMTSASLITTFASGPVNEPIDFARRVVLAEDSLLVEAWLMLGGVLAAPVFASTVIAVPMLMDRPVGVLAAVLTSWRVVLAQPFTMAVWAATIASLTLAGLITAMLGLVVIVPWLGHASWHAYRDLVGAPVGGSADGAQG
ncbi:MAG: DUF2189 domain-containing protein [Burkholderiaceae bacterium]